MSKRYLSWGRYFKYNHEIKKVYWHKEDLTFMRNSGKKMLPYGLGRSYGDSCLNDRGILIDVSPSKTMLSFDREKGLLKCEAGVTLAEILRVIVPSGWFLPVTPGTKFVTVGGAIANDVHGKNHHRAGTFGRYVKSFELARSDGSRLICSSEENSPLYRATIGGLGLTGLITWAEIQLKKCYAMIDTESIKFNDIDDFFRIAEEDEKFEYTVAWVDCQTNGSNLGRGIYFRGNHARGDDKVRVVFRPTIKIPFNAPDFLLNRLTIKAFNNLYFNRQFEERENKTLNYNSFFYPLDIIDGWNRIYGKRGFFQYQFVVPEENYHAVRKILEIVRDSGQNFFLSVLKKFGDLPSPGMLSFPQKGFTLAMDFANLGDSTKRLFLKMDDIINEAGGRIYPAKDSFMSPEAFRHYYKNIDDFKNYIDPGFSSSFWRRVNKDA